MPTPVPPENPAAKPEDKSLVPIAYSDKERDYLAYLQKRLEAARRQRDQAHQHFDGMTFAQYYESNMRLALSYIAPKKNREDVQFVTGTARQALLALCARLNGYNLMPEIRAFDEDDIEDVEAGRAMETILMKAGELDRDEEKRILRQYELYAQGTVFVEEAWTEEFEIEKTLNTAGWKGEVSGVEWSERLKLSFAGCRRNIIPGLHVYLGSLITFSMEEQPYVFTVDVVPYDEARAIYGSWERWQYVTRAKTNIANVPETMYMNNWRLTNVGKDHVEVIKYQDRFGNEFAVILNGVLMTPAGFPMPWKHRKLNLVKQINEILHPTFPYGGSLMKRLRTSQALEDEFWRLAILETQKKFMPPMSNMSGRILTNRVLLPGKINHGIPANALQPLSTSEGLGTAEVQLMNMLHENMNANSLSQVTQGQSPAGDQTATETVAIQREASITLGMALAVAALLEEKLADLTIADTLENWFEPYGTEADVMRGVIVKKYRSASAKTSLPDSGTGTHIVELGAPKSGADIYDEEQELSQKMGMPVRKTVLTPDEFLKISYTWYVRANPKPRESSDMDRAMFDMVLNRLPIFGPDVNLKYFEDEFCKVWDLRSDKAFQKQASQITGGAFGAPQPGAPSQLGGQAPPPGDPNAPPTPTMPTATGTGPTPTAPASLRPKAPMRPSINSMLSKVKA